MKCKHCSYEGEPLAVAGSVFCGRCRKSQKPVPGAYGAGGSPVYMVLNAPGQPPVVWGDRVIFSKLTDE